LSAVFPCPSDVYHARGAHGQACLRDLTLSSARRAPDQCARRQQPIDRLTGQNALLTAKVLLSYHRRLERYHLFFVEGRVRAAGATPTAVASSPSIDGTLDA
jgi:hypothetical protein